MEKLKSINYYNINKIIPYNWLDMSIYKEAGQVYNVYTGKRGEFFFRANESYKAVKAFYTDYLHFMFTCG